MTGIRTRIATVCRLLNDHDANYLLVGAAAMVVWGTSRATNDIDILIEPTAENAERVLEALGQLPFNVADDILPTDVIDRPVTAVGDTPKVDILTRAWDLHFAAAATRTTEFFVEGVSVPVASLDDLIASKRTGRPQDTADILVLEEIKRLRGLA
jgi:predicted nucleotidyltransferase